MNIEAWNSELSDFLIGNNIVLGLYLVLGVFGNGLVLFIYLVRMSKNNDDRYFIPSLAGIDACACVVGSSYALALNLLPVRFPGDILCRALWYFSQTTTISGGTLLLVIAVHRYLKVCRPFIGKWSLKVKRLVVLGTVAVAAVLSIPTIFLYGEIKVTSDRYSVENTSLVGYRCGNKGSAGALFGYNVFLFIYAVTGIVIITICYTFIGRSIYSKVMTYRKSLRRVNVVPRPELSVSTVSDIRRSKNLENCATNDKNGDHGYQEQPIERTRVSSNFLKPPEKELPKHIKRRSHELVRANIPAMKNHFQHYKYSYMFMTITVVFVIAYLPRIVIMLLESIFVQTFWLKSDSAIVGLLFLYRLYILNHVVNPFIYGFFDVKFRHEVKYLIWRRKNKPVQPDSHTGH